MVSRVKTICNQCAFVGATWVKCSLGRAPDGSVVILELLRKIYISYERVRSP